jgi:hypothetical protein
MPSKFSEAFRSNKLLFISFGLSLAMIVIGILLILVVTDNNSPAESPSEVKDNQRSLIDELDETESLIITANKDSPDTLTGNENVERGSEAWCEVMMETPDADWNDPDTRLFAQKCL